MGYLQIIQTVLNRSSNNARKHSVNKRITQGISVLKQSCLKVGEGDYEQASGFAQESLQNHVRLVEPSPDIFFVMKRLRRQI